jgi:hypothetical protein
VVIAWFKQVSGIFARRLLLEGELRRAGVRTLSGSRRWLPSIKVAVYQAPLLPGGSMEALGLIRKRIDWPAEIAVDVEGGQLDAALAPLASDTVTTILGFTEVTGADRLYNSAAVFHRGSVVGLYRKRS